MKTYEDGAVLKSVHTWNFHMEFSQTKVVYKEFIPKYNVNSVFFIQKKPCSIKRKKKCLPIFYSSFFLYPHLYIYFS